MSGYFTPGLPATPMPLTGNEKIPLDTGLSQGLGPETAYVSSALVSAVGRGPVIALGTIASGTITVDASLGSYFSVTIGGTGMTLTIENASPGQIIDVEVTQGSGGSKTITTYTHVEWPAATAPTLTATAAHIDKLTFLYNATVDRFRGSSALNFVNT
jgi:hypothetical protein